MKEQINCCLSPVFLSIRKKPAVKDQGSLNMIPHQLMRDITYISDQKAMRPTLWIWEVKSFIHGPGPLPGSIYRRL